MTFGLDAFAALSDAYFSDKIDAAAAAAAVKPSCPKATFIHLYQSFYDYSQNDIWPGWSLTPDWDEELTDICVLTDHSNDITDESITHASHHIDQVMSDECIMSESAISPPAVPSCTEIPSSTMIEQSTSDTQDTFPKISNQSDYQIPVIPQSSKRKSKSQKQRPQHKTPAIEYTTSESTIADMQMMKASMDPETPYIPLKKAPLLHIAKLIKSSAHFAQFMISEMEEGQDEDETVLELDLICQKVLMNETLPVDVVQQLSLDLIANQRFVNDIVGWDDEKRAAGWVVESQSLVAAAAPLALRTMVWPCLPLSKKPTSLQ